MSIQVTCHADQQLIIAQMSAPLDSVGDPLELTHRVAQCMGATAAHLMYCILDLSAIRLSFSEMVFALAVETRDVPGTFYDPRVVHVVITRDQSMQDALLALENTSIHVVMSMEEACAYIVRHRKAYPQNEGPPAARRKRRSGQ